MGMPALKDFMQQQCAYEVGWTWTTGKESKLITGTEYEVVVLRIMAAYKSIHSPRSTVVTMEVD